MKLYFRFLAAVFRALADRGRAGVLDESVLFFRVWPTDLDFNLHLNNARYLSFMDLGRLDLVAGFGVLRRLMRLRWTPVVGAAMLRFRRALDPWMRFSLHTRVVGWDGKWFYMEQRFEREGEVYAYALVRALFRGRAGSITPSLVLEAFGQPAPSPALPEVFQRWRETLDLPVEVRAPDLRRLA